MGLEPMASTAIITSPFHLYSCSSNQLQSALLLPCGLATQYNVKNQKKL